MIGAMRSRRLVVLATCLLAVVLSWVAWRGGLLSERQSPLLLAPMMDLDGCLFAHRDGPPMPESLKRECLESGGSAHLVDNTLAPYELAGLKKNAARPFALGFTLKVPLLQLFVQNAQGHWVLDEVAVEHVAETVAQSRYPVVMYLFSNHFSAHTRLETALAQEPANLAHGPNGVMVAESYHGAPLYPWSVARVDNALTRYRQQAVDAVVERLCARTPAARGRLAGITLLGETHQMFPAFEQGMAFNAPYRLSDYSAASVAAFTRYLAQRFPRVADLNRHLGSSYASHQEVLPPGVQPPVGGENSPLQFIGPFAHGLFPVSGWVHDGRVGVSTKGLQVDVQVDGRSMAAVPVDMSRQDVLAAVPSIGTAQVGYHVDLDYRQWTVGRHRIDVHLVLPTGARVPLGRRHVRVQRLDAVAVTTEQREAPIEGNQPLPDGVRAWLDNPAPDTVLSFNPLAELWHAFRRQQVAGYIQFFSDRLAGTCLEAVPRFTHQIFPQANPGWDVQRFAVQDSMAPLAGHGLGISLYGEAAWGGTFVRWLQASGNKRYGVTEFHPLQAMDAGQLTQVLLQHQAQGATFVSFFLETRWAGRQVGAFRNPYAFDPENSLFGSNVLYRATLNLTQ